MVECYDSGLGGQSIESVKCKSRFLDAKCRPKKPVYFFGSAAQDLLQSPYDQLLKGIYQQLDEDKKIVDALQIMMQAVDRRIVSNDFMPGAGE